MLMRARRPIGRPLDIAIIDYGMGNLGSVRHAFEFLGHRAVATSDPETAGSADAIVLPGVGAFRLAMDNLNSGGLAAALARTVLDRGTPFLGICLGMQLIAREGTEGGVHAGLGWIEGRVTRLEPGEGRRVPHVGWAHVSGAGGGLIDGIEPGAGFYFDHSYHLECAAELVVARCAGAFDCVAAVRRANIFATQFHPEKSQRSGLRLLRNFTEAARTLRREAA
ncbi:MAG: imidazole glycerol phosphate synthase subunit HisH [Rhodospirillales bacterium]|nr:imidazole glycerol phosphate synthase subunit HisH [Rhodospirillales bacterium]